MWFIFIKPFTSTVLFDIMYLTNQTIDKVYRDLHLDDGTIMNMSCKQFSRNGLSR
jgi:hypothetical protein